jgi:hydrophobic/amphiphilic exporter-1 (mainly G- bacteria), HAE1 family
MNFLKFCINNPVPVLVGVILLVLFGGIGLYQLPYQLSPDVTEPEISVTTTWQGATPYDVEREIIDKQEEVLKGIPGLISLESESFSGYASVTLKFAIGTDVDNALLRVSNKLNEVRSYPLNVDRPVISATGAATSPIIWMVLKTLPDNPTPIAHYRTYFEDEVRQHLERVSGVADLFVFGGTEREMHVIVDEQRLAAHQLTIDDIIRVLQTENVNVSSGTMDVGRRQYRIRTVGEFQDPEEIEAVVVSSTGERRVFIADVARVEYGYEKKTVAMLLNGEPGIVCGVKPEPGVNVLELTDAMEAVVTGLNQGQLKDAGLHYEWSYDQRPYIRGAIDLVRQNILIGGVLAIIMLLTFLRSISSTFIVAVAIPISIVGTFIFMNLLGRNLNVVSLAGISFAVGMLVDNAIVVLENIDRHRSMGKKPFAAAYDATREVWGAIMASSATTVAVFLPVIFMQEEAGQLFKDIAIAVTCAIVLSLFVSITVIPMLAKQLFGVSRSKRNACAPPRGVGHLLVSGIMALVRLVTANWFTRLATILLLTSMAVYTAWSLFPKLEYLPQGNRNMILNILIPPPGLSYEERLEIGEYIYGTLEPRFGQDEYEGVPGIDNMFYVGADRIMLFGVISTHEQRAGELVPVLGGVINSIPGMFGISLQAGIFQSRLGGGRTIDVDLSAGDMDRLVGGAGAMFGALRQAIPNSQIRPVPSIELLFPEVNIRPDREKLRAAGLTTNSLGVALDVLMEGRKVGEFKREGSKTIDLVLKSSDESIMTPEELYQALLVTSGGGFVPVSSLADLERTTGITQIRHLERQRTITLQVTPPADMPLQQAMEIIENDLVPQLREGPLKGIAFRMSGAADKLTETAKALQWNFLLAVAITYLLMSALFGNFIYPFVILFTVPLAAAGGILGLRLENLFIAPQPMDILTMLGFVILIGVVVNNAILIVHQSLNNIRIHGMEAREGVRESVRTRLRPIFMSACTSIFGMLPLAVAPGPGSELYRGLGSVVLGGLALSTVFTIFVIPAMLLFFIGMEKPGSLAENGTPLEEPEPCDSNDMDDTHGASGAYSERAAAA